jgi:Lon protease-like protein
MQLPMFPLGNVVLPGELLPLNVFEPRYRQLVLDCLAADAPEFGVVLIERGSEVGGGDVRTSIGTVARVVRVMPLGSGRFEVVAAGVRRANVLEWLPDDPYPRGDVEGWPEPVPVDVEGVRSEIERLLGRVDETRELAREVARASKQRVPLRATPPLRLSDDLVRAAYQLAARAPIGPVDRYRLLAAPSLEARIELLAAALDDAEAMLRFRLA